LDVLEVSTPGATAEQLAEVSFKFIGTSALAMFKFALAMFKLRHLLSCYYYYKLKLEVGVLAA
jgi:3-methyladenine DNA glycosylase Tag